MLTRHTLMKVLAVFVVFLLIMLGMIFSLQKESKSLEDYSMSQPQTYEQWTHIQSENGVIMMREKN